MSAPWFLHPWILSSGDTAAQKSQTQYMRPGRGYLILAECFQLGSSTALGQGLPSVPGSCLCWDTWDTEVGL